MKSETSSSSAIQYLYDLELFGVKLGLENIRTLCLFLGNPQSRYPVVHIAGTNGKGSTAAILESILLASGCRVGLYTSPHLVRFNERVRVNRQEVPDDFIEDFVGRLRPEIESLKATFFEATTALAFQYFAEQKVDIAVVETGLGGRLDATNVVCPVLSVITNVDKDHTDRLGKSLTKIATEKAGIIKPGRPMVVGNLKSGAFRTVAETAQKLSAPLTVAAGPAPVKLLKANWRGNRFHVSQSFSPSGELFLNLAGRYQGENLSVALAAVEHLRQRGFFIPPAACEAGTRTVLWPARLEMISQEPPVVLDVAHNAAAAARLAGSLRRLWPGKAVFVLGILADKDYHRFLMALKPLAKRFYFVRPDSKRALEPGILAEAVGAAVPNEVIEDPAGALWKAYALLGADELLVVTGSHYVAGKVLEAWQRSGRGYPLVREPEGVILG
ncbi:MAG: bifunctional folylpolyglutamate synthase/dihydrofolate synthase [candidate division Zixibacteria bacterium]|nr:bifunctional folylpolyglutamate synthase/dihydrofolate synthase [candidate division Zixibacteria bacterium]